MELLYCTLKPRLTGCYCAQKVYVRSKKNVLIEIHPQTRLPRTFRRFCGLLCQLLQKLSIRATNHKEKLLKVRAKGRVWVLRDQQIVRHQLALCHAASASTSLTPHPPPQPSNPPGDQGPCDAVPAV